VAADSIRSSVPLDQVARAAAGLVVLQPQQAVQAPAAAAAAVLSTETQQQHFQAQTVALAS
jgi:hypothetical protein